MDATEALAEAWASIDGRLDSFRECKVNKDREELHGHYLGYLADAKEMIDRLNSRGFDIVKIGSIR
jgi:hypothetical protein